MKAWKCMRRAAVAFLLGLTLILGPMSQECSGADWSRIRGMNFITSNAGNPHEMWLHFDQAIVDRELGWMHELGFNSVRLWLSVDAFRKDPKGFLANLQKTLDLCRKHGMTAMLVLFDSCGVEQRDNAQEMSIGEAYRLFLKDERFDAVHRKIIEARYSEYANGRGQLMRVEVAPDSPYDVLFWGHWQPNPGLSELGSENYRELEQYVAAVIDATKGHSQLIAIDVMNEPYSLFDLRGTTLDDARKRVDAFVAHISSFTRKRYPEAVLTLGSSNVEGMKGAVAMQSVLSFHSYALGDDLRHTLSQAAEFARSVQKPLLLTECLANTDGWLKIHGEERLSTDEAQLRHYRETLPEVLKSGMGWYSWGGVEGRMFTPFTDIMSANGHLRPAALYLQQELK